MTRPVITFSVSNVPKYSSKPTKEHWVAVKRIIRYLKGTHNLGLIYKMSEANGCIGFSDSNWAGDLDDIKSTSGLLFQAGGTAVSWRSRKQTCMALSTAEAEYIALSKAAQEGIWLRQLNIDL
uniref:Reverse transcriptase Ty1/copia-type domain-containing protein n=1 Tax=Amphimedon queenslandica TaxID=400682 RepID=A0A1X7VKA3_AMPQE